MGTWTIGKLLNYANVRRLIYAQKPVIENRKTENPKTPNIPEITERWLLVATFPFPVAFDSLPKSRNLHFGSPGEIRKNTKTVWRILEPILRSKVRFSISQTVSICQCPKWARSHCSSPQMSEFEAYLGHIHLPACLLYSHIQRYSLASQHVFPIRIEERAFKSIKWIESIVRNLFFSPPFSALKAGST